MSSGRFVSFCIFSSTMSGRRIRQAVKQVRTCTHPAQQTSSDVSECCNQKIGIGKYSSGSKEVRLQWYCNNVSAMFWNHLLWNWIASQCCWVVSNLIYCQEIVSFGKMIQPSVDRSPWKLNWLCCLCRRDFVYSLLSVKEPLSDCNSL